MRPSHYPDSSRSSYFTVTNSHTSVDVSLISARAIACERRPISGCHLFCQLDSDSRKYVCVRSLRVPQKLRIPLMESNLSGANWFRRWQYITESYTRRSRDKHQLKKTKKISVNKNRRLEWKENIVQQDASINVNKYRKWKMEFLCTMKFICQYLQCSYVMCFSKYLVSVLP